MEVPMLDLNELSLNHIFPPGLSVPPAAHTTSKGMADPFDRAVILGIVVLKLRGGWD